MGRERRAAQGGWGGPCWSTLGWVSLPPAVPKGCSAHPGSALPSDSVSLWGCLGTLRHTRGVQVPLCALMAAKNLSRPACIQDMEHQEPKLPAEAHKTPGYKLQRCKNMLAQQMGKENLFPAQAGPVQCWYRAVLWCSMLHQQGNKGCFALGLCRHWIPLPRALPAA